MGKLVRIGSRGSKLALWQANRVAELLQQAAPANEYEVMVVKTTGDKVLDRPLAQIGDKGLFTKELEAALLAGEVDLCVHSCKDMPTQLPEGLALPCFPERASARDCIVGTALGVGLDDIPAGARVATGSSRRVAQLKRLRPDVEVCDIRGNVDTRVGKVCSGEFDFAILAEAGMRRLGLEKNISSVIPANVLIPAVGQGAIAIETRADDHFALALCESIDSEDTRLAVEAERHVLAVLEGGCQVPMGAHGTFDEQGQFMLDAFVASLDGRRFARAQACGSREEAARVAGKVVQRLVLQGADDILKELQ